MGQFKLKAAPLNTTIYMKLHSTGCTYIITFILNWFSLLMRSSNRMVSLALQLKDQYLIGQVWDFLD